MRLCGRVSIEERIVTGCICLSGCILPFCLFGGIIISSLGIADNINRPSIYSQIYLISAVMLLILSMISCLCYSCTVLYKLREHSWAKRKYIYDATQNDSNRMNPRSEAERGIYASILPQGRTPPPIYSSTLVDSWNAREFLLS